MQKKIIGKSALWLWHIEDWRQKNLAAEKKKNSKNVSIWNSQISADWTDGDELHVVLVCLFETKKKIIINDEDERLRREMEFREIIMQKSY